MRSEMLFARDRARAELLRRNDSLQPDFSSLLETVFEVAPLLGKDDVQEIALLLQGDLDGLGRLRPFLGDECVADVLVQAGRNVWIERNGRLEATDVILSSDEVNHTVERIIRPLGLRVDQSAPILDARLQDGSRVNVVLPPLSVDGPCLTIRRFRTRPVALAEMADPLSEALLEKAVHQRANLVVSGGTGAGKTTLLNVLASQINRFERIITIEDAAELRFDRENLVRLECRPANAEGVGRVEIRDLVRNALRMRPDRIVVGEVRGAEAFDMIQAMNTGHEGSLSTCHANSPTDALRRLETMVLMSDVPLPLAAIRQQIGSAVDLLVQIERMHDGARCVVSIDEVCSDEHDLWAEPLIRRGVVVRDPQRDRLSNERMSQ